MSTRNRLHNCTNPHQGKFKKVLCVCSAGLLRSPTAAWILGQEPWGYNTRAAGLEPDYALIPVDEVLLEWQDEIICMTEEQGVRLKKLAPKATIHVLNVPDNFGYRDEDLVRVLKDEFNRLGV